MVKQKEKKNITLEEKLNNALVPVQEQPYEVPQNWCWVRMGKIIDLISGRDSSNKDCNDKGIGIPYILGASNLENNYFTVERWIEKPVVTSIKNDILISVKGTVGKLYIQKENVINISRQIMAIRVKNNLKVKYTYLYLKSITDKLKSDGYGLIPGIPREILLNKEIPLPPLPEQQRIVDLIERLFAKLDEAKEKVQTAIDSFELRKAAILHKAFTGELTRRWREEKELRVGEQESEGDCFANESQCSEPSLQARNELERRAEEQESRRAEGGEALETAKALPCGWKFVTISDIADVKGGKRVPKGMNLVNENTGHPYIKAGNLKEGTVIDDNIMYVTDEILKQIKNYTVSSGDVYITNVGACIGDCGVIPDKYHGANLTENAVKLTNLKCNNRFLYLYIYSTSTQSFIKSLIASCTLGKLSIANIKTISVPLPPLAEQKEIVRILDTLLEKSDKAKELAENALENIETLKKTILAKAFRGLLGTNRPDEACSLELLKEVL